MRLTLKEVDASLQWLSLHISEAYLTAYSSSRAFSSVCLPSVNSLTVSLISSLTFIPGGPLWVDGCHLANRRCERRWDGNRAVILN